MSNSDDHVKCQLLEKLLLLLAPTGTLYVIMCHNSHPGQKEVSYVVYFQAFIQTDIGHWYHSKILPMLHSVRHKKDNYDMITRAK